MRWITHAGIAASAILIVVLGLRVNRLTEAFTALQHRQLTVQVGDFVPEFRAANIFGDSVVVGAGPGPGKQLIFLLTTTCPYCLESLPAWVDLAHAVDTISRASLEVHAISLDSPEATARYAAEHGLQFSTLVFPQPRLARLYKANSVPQTLILNENGQVEVSRRGLLERGPALDSLLRHLREPAERQAP